jgi:PAS domain S-box-containing protein
MDDGPVVVFVADEQMRYIAVSRRACELLGYTRDELLELKVTDVAVYDDAAQEYAELVGKGVRSGRSVLRRKDGSEVGFRYRASTTTVARMTVYVAVGVED